MTAAPGAPAADAAGPVVELSGVDLTYHRRGAPPVHALRTVDLTIRPGERLAIVGRSGAGKSSLARLLLGLDAPTAGTVRILGQDLATLRPRAMRRLRRRLHLIFQDPYDSLHPGLPVEQAVAEPLAIAGTPQTERHDRVVHALTEVGLRPPETFLNRAPGSLSGGQRQRVAMARAIVAAPDLVIADEPTSMLDATLATTVIELLLQLQADHGTALVFVTHDLAVARHVADSVAVVEDGRVVERSPIDDLLRAPSHPASQRLVEAARTLHGDRTPSPTEHQITKDPDDE